MAKSTLTRLFHITSKSIKMRQSHSFTSNLVEVEQLGQVYLIGINRPEKRNCVNVATAQQLYDAFRHFENDDNLSVAVLHGKGGNFCAGYDLGELSNNTHATNIDPSEMVSGRGPMGPSRGVFSKPVIAAVAGYAVAGGLELACMADMRVAEENAIFGVFCRRFGVPLLDGGTARLPALLGLSRAMDLILTGRPVSAQEALTMGLANRVVPTGAALGEAVKLAQQLCNFPQLCMRRDRLSAYYAAFEATSFKDAVDYELTNGLEVVQEESVKGAQAFVSGKGKSGKFNFTDPTKKSKL